MLSSSTEFSQKSLQIKQDDKFFTRLLSKETSMANPSFRVYYGGASGAVPFTWEIQPGTPKHKFSDNSVPPLTPPPSYYFTTTLDEKEKPTKKHTRSKLLNILFIKFKLKKSHVASSSSSSSFSSSSSSSSCSHSHSSSMSSNSKSCRSSRRRFLSSGSSSSEDDGHLYGEGSMVCLGMNKERGDGGGARAGGCTVVIMKKTLLSIVGCGSG